MTGSGSAIGASAGFDVEFVLDELPDPVVVLDGSGHLVWGNRATEGFGWALTEWRGRPASDLVHPDDLITAVSSLASVQDKAVGTLVELRVRDASGTYRAMEVRGRFLHGPDRDVVVLVLRELSGRDEWSVAGGDPALLAAVLERSPAITVVLDLDGRVRSANRALTRMVGIPLEDLLGLPLTDLVAPGARAAVTEELQRIPGHGDTRSFEARVPRPHGQSSVVLRFTGADLADDDRVHGIVLSAVDITHLADTRDQLYRDATRDHLTGLVNRSVVDERFDAAIAIEGTDLALVYLDVDGFKAVNDEFGHAVGDLVLTTVGDRIRQLTRQTDVVARIGGDEIIILVVGGHAARVDRLAARARQVIATPIPLDDGRLVRISVSAGAARRQPGDDLAMLMARADREMYLDKRRPDRT